MPSEFELIRRHFVRDTPGALLGPGDDCALIAPSAGMELAVTTDMLVAGTHFFPDADPCDLGWKTLAVNLSDLAAMGATPRWVLMAGALPDADEAWIARFAEGFFECATRFGVDLIGGDTTRGPLNLCVTAIGEVPPGQALKRSGARADDEIWVSGAPGRAALALAHIEARLSLPPALLADCLAALHRPQPRIGLGIALRGIATAAIDVSDGLLGDLGHILECSGVGARVCADSLGEIGQGVGHEAMQDARWAGGDDYELVFTAPASARPRIDALSQRFGLPLTRIGQIIDTAARTPVLVDERGSPIRLSRHGYDHFQ